MIKEAVSAAILMASASLLAGHLTPTQKLADIRAHKVDLERVIPKQFGEWTAEGGPTEMLVNPQQLTLIKHLYNQILTRTYINNAGARVMLSIAYGEDQSDGLAVHRPEVCYPAQGFNVHSFQSGTLAWKQARIAVARLETFDGNTRHEPVTYWTTIGDHVVRGRTQKKLTEIDYGFKGLIPDGLLFRVSSIGKDSPREFATQDRFVSDLLDSIPVPQRLFLAGEE